MPPNFKPVKLHQCLYGYDDGHRLLAASTRLGTEANSLLLLLSDLAPGLSATGIDGYWTGVPITSAKSYALMRTWPAPEMPRPGCVWTQALLISFADIARFADLRAVTDLFTRPNLGLGFEQYASVLDIEPSAGAVGRVRTEHNVETSDALLLVDALYSESRRSTVRSLTGKLDTAIFGVWSQQWPRLRRSFSFRTAGGGGNEVPQQKFQFDIRMQTASEFRASEIRAADKLAEMPWAKVAAEDICSSEPTDFRRFIWRYGSDVRHGRDRFKFLAELYLESRRKTISYGDLSRTLSRVTMQLPALDDGKLLKQDLAGEDSAYSLLPASDPIEKLDFFLKNPENNAFPAPSFEAIRAVHELWNNSVDEIIRIADYASSNRSTLGETLLDRLAVAVDPSEFLAVTNDRPTLRRRLVSANPALLDSDILLGMQPHERLALLDLIPDDAPFAPNILDRLTVVDDAKLAEAMLKRFPTQALQSVAARIEGAATQDKKLIPDAWAQGVKLRASVFIELGFVEKASSTRVLAAFAEMLGYASEQVLSAGPIPWAKGFKNAVDDVRGHERPTLLTFLLTIALAKPVNGCELLLVATFEPIHTALRLSDLSYDLRSMLSPYLANLYWWEQWDTCLRLRITIVDAFIQGELDPVSFRRLTSEDRLREQLSKIANESKKGRRLLA